VGGGGEKMICPPTTFVIMDRALSSNISRGSNIAKLMCAVGHDVDYCLWTDIKNRDLSNRLVVFIKPREPAVFKVSCRGIVIDLVDDKQFFSDKGISKLIQQGTCGIVFPNQYSMLRLSKGNAAFGVVHGDYFHIPQGFRQDARPFCVGYFGSSTEDSLIRYIDDKLVRCMFRNDLLFDDHVSELSAYLATMAACPYHINIRNSKDKPPGKTIVAARCGSAIILNRDSGGSEDLLPEDYPYWTRGVSQGDINEALRYAEETYLGPVWDTAMIHMRAVVTASADSRVVDTYVNILCRAAEIADDK